MILIYHANVIMDVWAYGLQFLINLLYGYVFERMLKFKFGDCHGYYILIILGSYIELCLDEFFITNISI